MQPTNKLRFVERSVPMHPFYKTVDAQGNTVQAMQTYHVLQQFWEHTEWNAPGDWRDVPLEKEN
jgi:hypothetical protein